MTAPDRIACLNPTCRRTAPRGNAGEDSWVICGKCWRALPARFRDADRRRRARNKKLTRLSNKPKFGEVRAHQWGRICLLYDRAEQRWCDAVISYFTAGETPPGLENFLKENGFA
jgi:hypothetical protein